MDSGVKKKGLFTLFSSSLASLVRYGGRLSLHFKILSMVFFRFSPVNGGCEGRKKGTQSTNLTST